MSAAKHTPGPWEVERNERGTIIKAIGPLRPDNYAGSSWLEISEEGARLTLRQPRTATDLPRA